MPAAALGVLANSPALGAVFNQPTNQGLTTDDNSSTNGASTHAPSTNSSAGTNSYFEEDIAGLRH
jgi:hypothetical protein